MHIETKADAEAIVVLAPRLRNLPKRYDRQHLDCEDKVGSLEDCEAQATQLRTLLFPTNDFR